MSYCLGAWPPVVMSVRKWPNEPQWSVMTRLLREEPDGVWLGTVRGTRIETAGPEARFASGDSVTWCSPGSWWMPRWFARRGEEGRSARFRCYVDVVAPLAVSDGRVDVVDLDLDVVRTWEGELLVLDEDEFAAHTVSRSYPPSVVRGATAACHTVQEKMVSAVPPFAGEQEAVVAAWFECCEYIRSEP